MRLLLMPAVILFALSFAEPTLADSTTEYVQEALIELGYDPGSVDGGWGGRTRSALNEYRESKGLGPAEKLTGSSLYLLHREAPGSRTLPNPGEVLEGLGSRTEWLANNRAVAARHCNNRLKLPELDLEWGTVASFSESDATGKTGFISSEDDWHSRISEGLSIATARCVAGESGQCEKSWDYVARWAADDALKTPVAKRPNSEAFDGVAWIANSTLQPLAFAAALAEVTLDVPLAEKAPVLDWLYDRANHFNHVVSGGGTESANNKLARNHAMAAVLPSMTVGALLGDRTMFERGAPQFRAAIDNMRADGSFPTETRRGSRALHYTGLQLSYLTAMAEIARAQEEDFYGLASEKGRDLHTAVAYAADGWADWKGKVLAYARENIAAPKTPDMPMATAMESYYGWLPVYQLRFPEHANIARLRSLEIDPIVCSPEHVADRRAPDWWCRDAGGSPLTLRRMLLDGINDIAVFHPAMGFNAACLLAQSPKLLW